MSIGMIFGILRLVYFLITEGPEIWSKIKEIIGWLRSMDGDAVAPVALEFQNVVDEFARDWKAGDRTGRRLLDFHARLGKRFGRADDAPAGRRRRKGGANA